MQTLEYNFYSARSSDYIKVSGGCEVATPIGGLGVSGARSLDLLCLISHRLRLPAHPQANITIPHLYWPQRDHYLYKSVYRIKQDGPVLVLC